MGVDYKVYLGVDPMKWISVEDRLPKKDTECLVFEDGVMHVTEYVGWTDLEWFNVHGGHFPSHWMPLPEPPEDK